jgi:ferredoxin
VNAPGRLTVDPIACEGHGLCADLLPERIRLDDWGYPIIESEIPPHLEAHARRAVAACPTLALKLAKRARA